MITEKKILSSKTLDLLPTNLVFFDIETTGLKKETTLLYLIGCIFFEQDHWVLIQWFNEDGNCEREILTSFFQILKPNQKLVHYNGLSFDLPYIDYKRKNYDLTVSLQHFEQLDLYRRFFQWKNLLPLKSFRQKDLERFFDSQRKDSLSGKECIQIYQNYLKTKKSESLALVFLHNREDLFGLFFLFSHSLSYQSLEQKDLTITKITQDETKLCFSFSLKLPLPKPLHVSEENLTLQIHEHRGNLTVLKQKKELKFFYSNYKDYYYLPVEDYAIHKSIAQFVDKAYRKKATAKQCYQKKSGIFLPLPPLFAKEIQSSIELFREDYASKVFFAEESSSPSFLEAYFYALFQSLLSKTKERSHKKKELS